NPVTMTTGSLAVWAPAGEAGDVVTSAVASSAHAATSRRSVMVFPPCVRPAAAGVPSAPYGTGSPARRQAPAATARARPPGDGATCRRRGRRAPRPAPTPAPPTDRGP